MDSPIEVINLYSGSGGNSTYVKTPDGEFLIDAGKSACALKRALNEIGTDISKIKAIFITHEHGDHVSALKTLLKKNSLPIHAEDASSECILNAAGEKECVFGHASCFSIDFNNTRFTSFKTSHDSFGCVGYRVDYFLNDRCFSFGIATDTGYVTEEMKDGLCGCQTVILECNHDVDMLRRGSYPDILKRRILSSKGHLSNDACAEFAKFLSSCGTKYIMLAHLSKDNNIPSLAKACVENALYGTDTRVIVAKQSEITRFS